MVSPFIKLIPTQTPLLLVSILIWTTSNHKMQTQRVARSRHFIFLPLEKLHFPDSLAVRSDLVTNSGLWAASNMGACHIGGRSVSGLKSGCEFSKLLPPDVAAGMVPLQHSEASYFGQILWLRNKPLDVKPLIFQSKFFTTAGQSEWYSTGSNCTVKLEILQEN